MVYHHPVRRNLTSCGTFWHAETDAAVIANPVIALLLHCARGVALFGLVEAFVGNVRESPQPCHLPPRTYPIPSDHRSASCRSFLHCCECNLSPHATKLVTGTSGTQRVLRAASTRRFRAYLFSHPSSSFCYADTENKTGAVHGLSHVDPTAPQVQAALVSMKGVWTLLFLPELITIIDARDRQQRWRPGSPAMSLGSSLAGSSRRVSRKFRTWWWTWMKMGF
jgi:hypothetical protein